jgi:hypothetical protein
MCSGRAHRLRRHRPWYSAPRRVRRSLPSRPQFPLSSICFGAVRVEGGFHSVGGAQPAADPPRPHRSRGARATVPAADTHALGTAAARRRRRARARKQDQRPNQRPVRRTRQHQGTDAQAVIVRHRQLRTLGTNTHTLVHVQLSSILPRSLQLSHTHTDSHSFTRAGALHLPLSHTHTHTLLCEATGTLCMWAVGAWTCTTH